jgi:aminopeptidase N
MDTDAESRVLLPQDVTPTHYALELTPDLDALIFGCSLNITVTVNKSTDTVTLHSKEISIESATFNGENTLTQINYDLKATTVTLAFEKEFPLGEGNLLIKYKGILNGDMAGFYKSNYTDAEGKKKVMANTQFESLDARRALPCWDEPAVKATFSVTMIVPSNLTALSNMPEEYTTYIAGGKKKVQFQKSPKMSTYLLAFAVGEFDFIQGVTKNQVSIRVFSPPGRAQEGRFALDVAIRALEFYDDVFAVPYPLPKLDMLCCTEFAMGAMEVSFSMLSL